MKSKFIIISMLLIIICSPAIAAVNSTPSQVGRYQLFQGTYRIGSAQDGQVAEAKDVFKIDTVTGKTWVYMTGFDENQNPVEFWRLIEEKNAALKQSAQEM